MFALRFGGRFEKLVFLFNIFCRVRYAGGPSIVEVVRADSCVLSPIILSRRNVFTQLASSCFFTSWWSVENEGFRVRAGK